MTPWEDDLKCIPEPYRLSLAKYPDGETAWANSPDMVALLWYVAVVCRSTSDGPEAVTREIERAKQHLKQVSRYPGTSQVNHAAVRLNDELCRILECAPWKTPLQNQEDAVPAGEPDTSPGRFSQLEYGRLVFESLKGVLKRLEYMVTRR